MADAKKYWIGPGNLRVEKRLTVLHDGEITRQVADKLGKDRMAELTKAGQVGEKIVAISAAGRPSKEVVALKALVEAKDKAIEELTAKVAELEEALEEAAKADGDGK